MAATVLECCFHPGKLTDYLDRIRDGAAVSPAPIEFVYQALKLYGPPKIKSALSTNVNKRTVLRSVAQTVVAAAGISLEDLIERIKEPGYLIAILKTMVNMAVGNETLDKVQYNRYLLRADKDAFKETIPSAKPTTPQPVSDNGDAPDDRAPTAPIVHEEEEGVPNKTLVRDKEGALQFLADFLDGLLASPRSVQLSHGSAIVLSAATITAQLAYELGEHAFSAGNIARAHTLFRRCRASLDSPALDKTAAAQAFIKISEARLAGYLLACGEPANTVRLENTRAQALAALDAARRSNSFEALLALLDPASSAPALPPAIKAETIAQLAQQPELPRPVLLKAVCAQKIARLVPKLTAHACEVDFYFWRALQGATNAEISQVLQDIGAIIAAHPSATQAMVELVDECAARLGWSVGSIPSSLQVPEIAAVIADQQPTRTAIACIPPPAIDVPGLSTAAAQAQVRTSVDAAVVAACYQALVQRGAAVCQMQCRGLCTCTSPWPGPQQLPHVLLARARSLRQQSGAVRQSAVSFLQAVDAGSLPWLPNALLLEQCATAAALSSAEDFTPAMHEALLASGPPDGLDCEAILAHLINVGAFAAAGRLAEHWPKSLRDPRTIEICRLAATLATICISVRSIDIDDDFNGEGEDEVLVTGTSLAALAPLGEALCRAVSWGMDAAAGALKRKRDEPDGKEKDTKEAAVDIAGTNWAAIEAFHGRLTRRAAIALVLCAAIIIYNKSQADAALRLSISRLGVAASVLSAAVAKAELRDVAIARACVVGLASRAAQLEAHVPFRLTLADTRFVDGQHAAALREYCDAITIGSRTFTRRIPAVLTNTRVLERIVPCLMSVGAYVQAVVVCQFLAPIDYAAASKAITNICGNVLANHGAAESYFTFLFDSTVLEMLVYHYTKLGLTRAVASLVQQLGRTEFNEATDPALRGPAVANVRQDALHAICAEFAS
eukprot:m.72462 g.72462  ORF g.72462 m.72462 type:complete len:957 (-) comp7681_c0_seq1:134-3004(-)